MPALIVTAVVGGRPGIRDLAPPVSALAGSAALVRGVPAGAAGRRSCSSRPCSGARPPCAALGGELAADLVTSFLPTLVFMIVLNNVAEEAAWTGFLFARLQDRHAPLRAALLV